MARHALILSVVVCDDVRKEASGKDILIGAYSGNIQVGMIPGNMPIAFWLQINPNGNKKIELELRLQLPGLDPIQMTIGGEVQFPEEPAALALPQIFVPIVKEGEVRLSYRVKGTEKWNLIKRVSIRRNHNLPSQIVLASPPTDTSQQPL